MEFLYLLEELRTPLLDAVVSALTHLGGETVFLIAAMAVFWCVDKRQGYYLMSVGFMGTLVNQFLKITCRILRPWVRDPHFTIVESARAEATGYSFPSGHSTSSVGTFGVLATESKRLWLRLQKKPKKRLLVSRTFQRASCRPCLPVSKHPKSMKRIRPMAWLLRVSTACLCACRVAATPYRATTSWAL